RTGASHFIRAGQGHRSIRSTNCASAWPKFQPRLVLAQICCRLAATRHAARDCARGGRSAYTRQLTAHYRRLYGGTLAGDLCDARFERVTQGQNGRDARKRIGELQMKGAASRILIFIFLSISGSGAFGQATLDAIKARGTLNCGVSGELIGFSMQDPQAQWSGLDVDYCRAIAAVIFNDTKKVAFVPVTTKDR